MSQAREHKIVVPGGEVRALLDGPEDAPGLIVLAPGAGAGMTHVFMATIAAGLSAQGIAALRFDFLYTAQGRKAPDPAPVLKATYSAVAEWGRAHANGGPLLLGGKSMGGRIASEVVAGGLEGADGLVFLGYPLHPPGRPDRLRDMHLYDIEVPMLFVEGTRDPFCPLPTLERVLAKVGAPVSVAVIEDGDHSFKVRKSSGRSTEEAWAEVVAAVSRWRSTLGP